MPLAAAVYFDDLYVDAGLQLDTLARTGNSQYWVTNEFEHDGISNARVLRRLRELVRDRLGGER
ncbi:proline iminopeptidase [Ruaniaceae bacterium KH17]|nr:proline iminopeptidase [Ruaniaceae bacterium KH17]